DLMSWGETDVHHEKSSAVGGSALDLGTDLTYGGSSFSLNGGESGNITVSYEGDFQSIILFLNSSIYNDSTAHSGSILISNVEAIF
ncbi:MAG: hypothetical protein J6328_02825, partial [Bacilli bacterium]|nr:hypothetical protein [Bacilli bacterium]